MSGALGWTAVLKPNTTASIEFAWPNGEKFGIWGELSERERRRIRRQRAKVARGTITA